MFRNALYESVSDDRLPVPDVLFGRVCRSTPAEARDLCASLPEGTRAKLAIFCNARAHLRGIGRAIASVCSEEDLIAEGGYAGAMLFGQIKAEPDRWGITTKHHLKRINLPG